jgi:hypothetical protein
MEMAWASGFCGFSSQFPVSGTSADGTPTRAVVPLRNQGSPSARVT